MKAHLSAIIIAAVCVTSIAAASGAQIAYSLTQIQGLPDPAGRPMAVIGLDLNDNGQVVGYMEIRSGFPKNPFITGPNGIGLRLLVPPPNDFVLANGVNNSGQVTVVSGRGSDPQAFQSFLSEPNGGALHPIGGVGAASAVNNHGQVTGRSVFQPAPTEQHAFLTSANGGALMDLGTLGGTFSYTTGVNDNGEVAGSSYLKGDLVWHAFLSEPNGGPLHDLGTFGGKQSFANGVNEAGQAVGFADLRGGSAHAFLSGPDGGALLDLGTLGGAFSGGLAVNDSGVVVGDSYLRGNNELHAFIYSPSAGMQDLNDLIDLHLGFELITADAINNRGQILAIGNVDGRQAAFLLTPISGVPDSGSTGLLLGYTLAGFFLAGTITRRFRKYELVENTRRILAVQSGRKSRVSKACST